MDTLDPCRNKRSANSFFLFFFLTNLDQTKNINIFHRIPEKEKMIQQLKEQLTDIDFDMNRMKDIMGFIWGERD